MAEVKLDPCSSRYALPTLRQICRVVSTCDIPVSDIDHPFRIGVSEIAVVGWSQMDLGLVKRIRDVIWEDTCRQTRDHFGYSKFVRIMEYVVINEHVVSQERVLGNTINQSLAGDLRTSIAYLEFHVTV